MTQTTESITESNASTATVAETLDRLSLEQALIDVEVANARVIDLTGRLTESHLEAQQLRQQVLKFSAPDAPTGGLRALVVGPIKAVARSVLPLSVRTRLRSALG
jgi:hypothetical protein